jgi:probable rRNA maturation factor
LQFSLVHAVASIVYGLPACRSGNLQGQCISAVLQGIESKSPRAALFSAPGTMILLDPDLEPDSTPALAGARQPAAPGLEKNLRIPTKRTLARYLSDAQAAVGLSGQVTALLTTDRTIRDLNRRFRGKDEATDVLSFSATNPSQIHEKIAGDVAISVETARKQAIEQGHSLGVELRVLMLHGLLHLAGYDHETDEGRMQRRERQLRARLGLPQGLIERTKPERTGPRGTKTRRRKP